MTQGSDWATDLSRTLLRGAAPLAAFALAIGLAQWGAGRLRRRRQASAPAPGDPVPVSLPRRVGRLLVGRGAGPPLKVQLAMIAAILVGLWLANALLGDRLAAWLLP